MGGTARQAYLFYLFPDGLPAEVLDPLPAAAVPPSAPPRAAQPVVSDEPSEDIKDRPAPDMKHRDVNRVTDDCVSSASGSSSSSSSSLVPASSSPQKDSEPSDDDEPLHVRKRRKT